MGKKGPKRAKPLKDLRRETEGSLQGSPPAFINSSRIHFNAELFKDDHFSSPVSFCLMLQPTSPSLHLCFSLSLKPVFIHGLKVSTTPPGLYGNKVLEFIILI